MTNLALPIFFLVASITTLAVIIFRKLPQLSLLDVDSLPEVKEEKKKNQYLKLRVEKMMAKTRQSRIERWLPFWQLLRRVQLAFRRYVGKIERAVYNEAVKLHVSRPKAGKDNALGQIRATLSDAGFAFEQGDMEVAEKKYLAIIRLDPKNKEAYRGLGDVYAKLGHISEAMETYRFVHQLDPQDDYVLVKLAELMEGEGNIAAAVEYYEQALLLNDNLSGRFYKVAELLQTLGQYPTALEAVEQALELEPKNPKYLDTLIEISILVGNKDLASQGYNDLRLVNPENQRLPVFKDRIEKIQL